MNSKPLIFLLLAVSLSALFSACKQIESNTPEEVIIDDGNHSSNNQVLINESDFKNKRQEQISTTKKSTQERTRFLPDKSEVETLIDGFGNKTETRHFNGHPRLRFIILRTSVEGTKEVTVYGYGSDTKMLPDLGDKALTASGDEIANSAKLYTTHSYSEVRNYLKKRKTETPLQPLPSSQFPIKPIQPIE